MQNYIYIYAVSFYISRINQTRVEICLYRFFASFHLFSKYYFSSLKINDFKMLLILRTKKK